MAEIIVKVKEGAFPVRYNGERYSSGQEITIDEKHFNASVMEKFADVQLDYEKMKVDELKQIASEKSIDSYQDMKKDELVAALKATESE